jgi:Tfp pilus assembly protein PilF
MPGLDHAEIDLWGIETEVLGPAQGLRVEPAPAAAQPAASQSSPSQADRAAEQHYQRGLELKRGRQAGPAADEFRAALATDPKHVRAHYALGWVLVEVKDKVGAAAAFRKVIELAPASEEAKGARKALDRIGG